MCLRDRIQPLVTWRGRPMKNLRPSRHQEEWKKGTESPCGLMEPQAVGLTESNGENEMGYLYLEMQDWYREEEDHSAVKAV